MFSAFQKFLLQCFGFYPSRCMRKVHLAHVTFGIIMCIAYNYVHYFVMSPNSRKFNIYLIVDVLQKEVLIFVQIFIFYQNHRINFFESLSRKFKIRFSKISQTKFQKTLVFILSCFTLKLMMKFTGSFPRGLLFILSTANAELTLLISNLLFILLVENLRNNLRNLRLKVDKNKLKKEFFCHVQLEIMIFNRFSCELFLSISLYYIKLIISLYWMFIRLTYKRFSSMQGEPSI